MCEIFGLKIWRCQAYDKYYGSSLYGIRQSFNVVTHGCLASWSQDFSVLPCVEIFGPEKIVMVSQSAFHQYDR